MDGRRRRDVRASNSGLDFDSTSKNMDGVESNMVLEVPDTPDRLAMTRPVDGSSKSNLERNSFRLDVNPNCDPVRRTHVSRQPNHHNSTGSSDGANDTEFFFREASLAQQLCGTAEMRPSSDRSVMSREQIDLSCKSPITVSDHTGCLVSWRSSSENGTSAFEYDKRETLYGDNTGLKSRDKGKGIDLCSNLKLGTNINHNVSNSVNGEMSSSCTGTNDRDNAKGKYLCGDLALVNGQPSRPRRAQRRLVRNGCISPLNIERSMKQKGAEVRNNGCLSNPIHIISPDSQGQNCGKLKGIATVEDIVAANDGSSNSNYGHMFPGEEATAISGAEVCGRRFEDKGWRTTRNHMSKPSSFPTLGTGGGLGSENPSSSSFIGTHEAAMADGSSVNTLRVDRGATALQYGVNTIVLPDSEESQRQNGRINRKRKVGSFDSLVSECSSSISNDPENLNIGSSRQPLNTRSTRTRRSQRDGLMLGPVIEVDELQYPEAVSYSLDQHRQVVSDEMLARQLQEELYNETPGIGNTNEIDASIAMLLQENDGSGATIARHQQSRRRDLSNVSTRTRFRQAPAISRARASTSSRMAQLRREFHRTLMDLNTRLDIMGAVGFGDGGDDARMFNILHSQRDFDENDYETLLQLDENNHQRGGASESQINSLPQSVIENADSHEACAVCLEPPAVGDTIRHLPCLHKFHKDCIDAWLRRKRLCPICKHDI